MLKFLPQSLSLLFAGIVPIPCLHPRRIGGIHFIQCQLLGFVVNGADGARALEGHVLKNMGNTSIVDGLICAADINEGDKGGNRCNRPFNNNKMQTVIQCEFGHSFCQRLNILGIGTKSSQHGQRQNARCQSMPPLAD